VSSVALGSVQIIPRVARLTTLQLPASWAVSFDSRGRHIERAGAAPQKLRLRRARNVIVSSSPAALLLHRLAELHARLKPGQFPIGADRHDRLHLGKPTYWTTGFWPGALWQAAALVGQPFTRWALSATVRHFGYEREPTHDVGFMYGQSSLQAWAALCRGHATRRALCRRLKHSVLAAATELRALAASDPGNGLIPTNPYGPNGDTIVDSIMNVTILPWATGVTHNPLYAELARHQAKALARLLVRRDGSTAQAVNFVRATGHVLSISTHQGLSARSTWARGQAWAVYGFALVASELRSRSLLRVAERTARYVQRHLPADGVPLWDYDARPHAAVDVSAGVITAAGLFHLARACRQLPGACRTGTEDWAALGRHMLAGSLAYASSAPPLGLLLGQDLNEHAPGCWCNDAELSFGLSYALEAIRLAKGT
jgi:unsaturated chondroitin disaccharide hydrolase